jgi:complement component 1 Q subcomponent-binding protein
VQTLARGPPQPFTLTDTAGKPEVILRRSFGEEDIALTCVTQPGDFVRVGGGDSYNEQHEDQDPDEHRAVIVKVSVTKGADQPVLEFSCYCQPDSIAIGHVCYLESKDLKDTFYDGPEFS